MPRVPLKTRHNQDFTALRKRLRGVSLTDLEAASGVARSTIWRVRQGRGNPDIETIDAIWAGLGALDEADTEAQ